MHSVSPSPELDRAYGQCLPFRRAALPLTIQTGVGLPADFRQRYPDLPVHSKPVNAAQLVEEIAALIEDETTPP